MKCPVCSSDLKEHSPSRCLDAWCAERVMGWTPCHFIQFVVGVEMRPVWRCEHGRSKGCFPTNVDALSSANSPLPRFSGDIEEAWRLLTRLMEQKFKFNIFSKEEGKVCVRLTWDREVEVEDPSAPLAISKAALLAVGMG